MAARRLVFVTGNRGKAAEARAKLAPLGFRVEQRDLRLAEIQASSLEEVASWKVQQAARRIRAPFFLEDAGLFVDALNGFPGVYSSYAHATLGCSGLLRLLASIETRAATFRAVMVYVVPPRRPRFFVGECRGRIAREERGSRGFGFDPVFVPEEGDGRTFAELAPRDKNRLSHRGRALDALAAHLATELARKTRGKARV